MAHGMNSVAGSLQDEFDTTDSTALMIRGQGLEIIDQMRSFTSEEEKGFQLPQFRLIGGERGIGKRFVCRFVVFNNVTYIHTCIHTYIALHYLPRRQANTNKNTN